MIHAHRLFRPVKLMLLACWFTQHERDSFPVEGAALGSCDLSVRHIGGEWNSGSFAVMVAISPNGPRAGQAMLNGKAEAVALKLAAKGVSQPALSLWPFLNRIATKQVCLSIPSAESRAPILRALKVAWARILLQGNRYVRLTAGSAK